jgi:alginate O-acetyltransferase complex protein AlgI
MFAKRTINVVFSSITFLLYFLPGFLLTYYLSGKKLKNTVLLISSILFYAWGAPKFIFVILGTTLIDFKLVQIMWKAENPTRRKLLLTLSIVLNVGLLFYFKYFNFFIENINVLLSSFGGNQIHWAKLILPIGISFYTFETITYVVDVYRRIHKPLDNFWDYQLYIILFPKLIAGPIIRFHEIADQIKDRTLNDTSENRFIGFYRFSLGLGKKVIIGNQVGKYADAVFGMDFIHMDSYTAWMGIIAYTIQLYFDFSGYSDMAIGLAKMIGFKFPENFNNPYTSQSITEFWRRWHITLGNWMRNYLYIPLGGSKVESKSRLYFNLWFVFLASGLWHGASWSFIVWGAYHGLFLVLERAFLLRIYEKSGKWLRILITFFIVIVGWVFFRAEKLSDALVYIKQMFSFRLNTNSYVFPSEFYLFLVIGLFFAFFTSINTGQKIQDNIFLNDYTEKRHLTIGCISILLFLISLSYIATSDFNPFIYFRF